MKLQLPKSSGKKVSAETLYDPNGWFITRQLHSTEQTNRLRSYRKLVKNQLCSLSKDFCSEWLWAEKACLLSQ